MVTRVKTKTLIKIVSSFLKSEVISSTTSENLGKTFHTQQISKNVKSVIPSNAKDIGKLVEPQWS